MLNFITPEKLIALKDNIPVIDVRSPAEYQKGHVPGAINIPLFSNDERAVVGISYKNEGKQRALITGLEIVGPKLAEFVKEAHKLTSKNKQLIVYCWRGGMRSSSMATLFHAAEIHTMLIKGGYKAYRNYVQSQIAQTAKITILSGETGSGKTEILYELQNEGEQIIDLEKLAQHKGSVFGGLGQQEQPTSEQFENNLFEEWNALDLSKRLWLEDESSRIGKVSIPEQLWRQMRQAEVVTIKVDVEQRIDRLLNDYGSFDRTVLLEALEKIRKRIHGPLYNQALEATGQNDYRKVAALALSYYDRAYNHGLAKRDANSIKYIDIKSIDNKQNAIDILSELRIIN